MAYSFVWASSQYASVASAPVVGTPVTLAIWFNASIAQTSVAMAATENAGTHRHQLQLNPGSMQVGSVGPLGTDIAQTSVGYSTNTWNHLCGVIASSTSRTVYFNGGNSVTTSGDVGTQNTFTGLQIATRIVNNSAAGYFDGLLAEAAAWDVALTAEEVASLAKGMTCDRIRPQNLQFYAPLIRNLQDVRGGLTITNNNTATVADHPRVY